MKRNSCNQSQQTQQSQETCPQGQIYCQVPTEHGPVWACAPPSQCVNSQQQPHKKS